MKRDVAIVIGISVMLLVGGCSAPTPAPTPFPTLAPIPQTLAPTAPTATTQATVTTPPTAATTPTHQATVNAQLSPSPSRPASTQSPSPSPSPSIAVSAFPPGVYVTELRTDPNPPTRTAELKFYATFLNLMGSPQNYRWKIYIYKMDAPGRSTGETTQTPVALPNGATEQKSEGFWRYGPGNQCESFFVRVAWLDQNNVPTMFTRPDGKVFEKSMILCP